MTSEIPGTGGRHAGVEGHVSAPDEARPWWDRHASRTPPPPPGTEPSWGMGDVAISFAVFVGVQAVLGVALALSGVTSEQASDPSAGLTMIMAMSTWVGFGLWPLIIVRLKGLGSLRRDFGLELRGKDVLWALGGFGVFFAIGAVASVVYSLLSGGGSPPSNADIVDTATTSTGALIGLFLVVAVGAPIFEELWFRGFLMRAVGKRWGAATGLVSSSLVFGVFHFRGSGIGDLWIMGLLAVYGAILAFIDQRNDGRIGPSIICHAINNGLTFLLVVR